MKCFFWVLSLISCLQAANAQVILTGNISTDSTLTINDGPVTLSGQVTIGFGAILTLEAGIELSAEPSSNMLVNGELQLLGGPTNNIIIRNASPGSMGGSIVFRTGSRAMLSNVTIDSMGEGGIFYDGAIMIESSDVSLSNVNIRNSSPGMIIQNGSTPTIENCTIEDCTFSGVWIKNGSPSVRNSIISGTFNGLLVDQGSTPLIENNTFFENEHDITIPVAAAAGLYNNQANSILINGVLSGQGTLPNDAMVGQTIYRPSSSIAIDAGATLNIDAGNILEFDRSGSRIIVNGTLNINGTATDTVFMDNGISDQQEGRIIFNAGSSGNISYAVLDSMGGSGFAEANSGIQIYSPDVTIHHTTIRNCSEGIRVGNGSAATIEYSIFENNSWGIRIKSGAPLINGCTFDKNLYGLYVEEPSRPYVSNNIFLEQTNDNIYAHPMTVRRFTNNVSEWITLDGSVTGTAILPNGALTGETVYEGGIYVDSIGGILEVEAGVRIVLPNFSNITVNGEMYCRGEVDNPVTISGIGGKHGGNIHLNATSIAHFRYVLLDSIGGRPGLAGSRSVFEIASSEVILEECTIQNPFSYGITVKNGTKPVIRNSLINGPGAYGWYILDGNPVIEHCETSNFSQYGLYVVKGKPNIKNSSFHDNVTGLFVLNGQGSAILKNTKFFNHSSRAILNQAASGIIDARNCWWGFDSGPFHSTLNSVGEGDEVSDRVWFNPWILQNLKNIPIGVILPDTFPENIQRYYVLEIPDSLVGESIRLQLTTNAIAGNNEWYGSYDELPTRGQSDLLDHGGQEGLEPVLILPDSKAGQYFFMVYPDSTDVQEVDIFAEVLDFQLNTINPIRGGNTATTTLKITGARFEEDMTVSLSLGEVVLDATKLSLTNPTEAFVTFDLRGLQLGQYQLTITRGDGQQLVLNDAFEVVEGEIIPGYSGTPTEVNCSPGEIDDSNLLFISISNPEFARPFFPVPITIHYENIGTIDIPIPKRVFTSVKGLPMAFVSEEAPNGKPQLLLALEEEGGPEGILRAGAQGSITVYVMLGGGTNEFKLLK